MPDQQGTHGAAVAGLGDKVTHHRYREASAVPRGPRSCQSAECSECDMYLEVKEAFTRGKGSGSVMCTEN